MQPGFSLLEGGLGEGKEKGAEGKKAGRAKAGGRKHSLLRVLVSQGRLSCCGVSQ